MSPVWRNKGECPVGIDTDIVIDMSILQLRPGCMLFYILVTMVKILAMVILIISDIILLIWVPVIIMYVVMFGEYSIYLYTFSCSWICTIYKYFSFCIVLGIYFWFVVYSFYAALGGSLFI